MSFMKKAALAAALVGLSQVALANEDLTTWTLAGSGNIATNDATIYTGSVYTGDVGGTYGAILSKDFSFAAGSTVSFDWDFHAGDYMPYNDFALVTVGGSTYGLSNVAAVGDFGDSGWQHASFTLSTATQGSVAFLVSNYGDNGFNSSLSVANVNVSAVPEPASMGLMLAGLGVMGAALRRRQG